jgi:protein disulfide-isomerase A6
MRLAAVLLARSACEVLELSPENATDFIGGSKPILVKFYNPDCPHCRAMSPAFEAVSKLFAEVSFGAMNCIRNKELCTTYNVNTYPTVHLFQAGSTEAVDYDGDKSLDSFADFVELHTAIQPARRTTIDSTLDDVTPVTFPKLTASFDCFIAIFYIPTCEHSRRLMPQVEQVSTIFGGDDNVTFGSINCEKFSGLCAHENVTIYPTLRLALHEEWRTYSGARGVEDIVNFVNTQCDTERGYDGLLNDDAGTTRAGNELVDEFLATDDKAEVIRRTKKAAGCEFYAKIMERFVANGVSGLKKDVQSMKAMLDERKGSIAALDGMKRRYNVFMRFIPPPSPYESEVAADL